MIKIQDFTKKKYIHLMLYSYSLMILFVLSLLLNFIFRSQEFLFFISICIVVMFISSIIHTINLKVYLSQKDIKKGRICKIEFSYLARGSRTMIIVESEEKLYMNSYMFVSSLFKENEGHECTFILGKNNKAYVKTIFK